MKIQQVKPENFDVWMKLRKQFWVNCDEEKHRREMKDYLSSPEKTVFFAEIEPQNYIGLVEVSIRHLVEGTSHNRVGYLEGLYILPKYRKKNVAKQLISEAEKWAKEQGCLAMASDTGANNDISIEVHKKLGYKDICRLVHFVKDFEISKPND
ncbi:MAG: aminoglycoside 6'-N-acetyltransferase [Candidatus Rhabdochlamydia sp.]